MHKREHNNALLWSSQIHVQELRARIDFHLSRSTPHFTVISHMTDLTTPSQGQWTISKRHRQVAALYSREHFIMNLWDASLPCSRHACPASYSGSYLNNWFQNLESQSCEFHAYQQVEEQFFNRACSRHGSGECMFYELGKHENTADCQLGNFPLG